MPEIRNERYYSKTHEWVLVKGDIAAIGLSDFGQKELGDLVYAEAEVVGTEIEVADLIGSIESVKMAADLYSPVSGVIVAANDSLADKPESINQQPYETWLVKIALSAPEQLQDLLSPQEYAAFCAAD